MTRHKILDPEDVSQALDSGMQDNLAPDQPNNIQQHSTPPVLASYSRIPHAGHYAGSYTGHDLDRWIIRSEAPPTVEQVTALGIAPDAKYHSGYIHNGEQHWVYTAIRPLSVFDECPTCKAGTP